MKKMINLFITKVKGEDYSIDPGVPASYLFGLSMKRSCMLMRGFFSFIKRKGVFFRGRMVTIKAKSLIQLGAGVTIDDGCYIDALSKEGIRFGNNVAVGKRTVIECTGSLKTLGKGLQVGDNVGLGRDAFYGCAGGIEIGSDTIIGNYVSMHAENHNYAAGDTPIRLQGVNHKGIVIGSNCWIGAKATILDGAIIESGCVIAAGAVIGKGRYESNGIYGGNPAKLIKPRLSAARTE